MLRDDLTPAALRLVRDLQAKARRRFDGHDTPFRTGMVAGLDGVTMANPYSAEREKRDFARGVVKGRRERGEG